MHQMFFFEHVLMRIASSKYKNNIILKGGVLLSSIIGEDLRTTKDMDTTLKSIHLNVNEVSKIFQEILETDIHDNVYFEIVDIKDIREEDEYGGFKLNVKGVFGKIKNNFFIEITTGDIITPREIEYKYNSIFEDKKINIMAYTIETVIAEKFHSIIIKNIITTRAKDFYDIYMLINKGINNDNLINAIKNTFIRRNTSYNIEYFKQVLNLLKEDNNIKNVYLNYQNKLEYARKVTYEYTLNALKIIIKILEGTIK